MLNPRMWFTVSEAGSVLNEGGSAATVGEAVVTWRDQVGQVSRGAGTPLHAVATSTGGAAGNATNRPIYGVDGRQAPGGQRGITFSHANHRLSTPAGALVMGSTPHTIFVFMKVRPQARTGQQVAVGHSGGNFNYALQVSDAAAPGRVLAHAIEAEMEVNTAERFAIFTIERPSTQPTVRGRVNGSEITSGNAASNNGGDRAVIIGNLYAGNSAADAEYFEVLVTETGLSRANQQRMEGWIAHTYGVAGLLPAEHPYKSFAPRVPSGTVSTVDWTDVQPSARYDLTTWLGHGIEIQPDAFNGGDTTPPNNETTDLWGFPYSLNQAELDRARETFLPGDGEGVKYIRFPLGFAYRGFRRINPASGLADRIGYETGRMTQPGPNGRNMNEVLRYFFANISDVSELADKDAGGGLSVAYWSVPPHFKTTRSYSKGMLSWGSFEREVTIALGTPGVVTLGNHGFAAGTPVILRTTGRLPSGLTSGGQYYVANPTETTFELAATAGGASLTLSGTQSGVQRVYAGTLTGDFKALGANEALVYQARIAEIADAMIDDLEYLHTHVAPVKHFTPFNEASNPQTSNYGTTHPVDDQVLYDLWFDIIPKLRGSAILRSLALYGGGAGQNIIRLHNDSFSGQSGGSSVLIRQATETMSTGKTVLQEMSWWSEHRISTLGGRDVGAGTNYGAYTDLTIPDVSGSGADFIRTGISKTGLMGLPKTSDEFEYFNVNMGRPWRFTNLAMNMMNWIVYFQAPTFVGPLHFGKAPHDPALEGYSLSVFRPQAPFRVNQGEDDFDALAREHFEIQNVNWGPIKPFLKQLQWGSVVKGIDIPVATVNFRAMVWQKPDGRYAVGMINRQNAAYAPNARVGLAGVSRAMRGTRYALGGADFENLVETDLGVAAGSGLPINLEPWSIEVWVEEPGVNRVPVITENGPLVITLSQNNYPTRFQGVLHGQDEDGDALTWRTTSGPGHGAVTLAPSGNGGTLTLNYTPALDYIGADLFSVEVSDGRGGTDSIQIQPNVTAVSSFDRWRWERFHGVEPSGTDEAIWGRDADPDGDRLTNFAEYAAGMEPLAAGAWPLAPTLADGVLSVIYARSAAATDAEIFAAVSGDLADAESWSRVGVTQSLLSEENGIQLWKAMAPVNGAREMFLRLEIEGR